MRLGHADRHGVVTGLLHSPKAQSRLFGIFHLAGAVHGFRYPLYLALEVHVHGIEETHLRLFLRGADDGAGQFHASLAAQLVSLADGYAMHVEGLGAPYRHVDLFFRVRFEPVDAHDHGKTEHLQVLHLLFQVGTAPVDGRKVLFSEFRRHGMPLEGKIAAVDLERSYRAVYDRDIRLDLRLPAFYVYELLRAEVHAEAAFRHSVIGKLQGEFVGDNGARSVRYVRESPGMHKARGVFYGLHQVRVEGLFQEHRHGPRRLDILGRDRLALLGITDHYLSQAGPQVFQVLGQ